LIPIRNGMLNCSEFEIVFQSSLLKGDKTKIDEVGRTCHARSKLKTYTRFSPSEEAA
jgi:hypothetical protein